MKKLAGLVALAAFALAGCSSPGYAKNEELNDALPPLGKLPELAEYVTAIPTPTTTEPPPTPSMPAMPSVITVPAPTPAAPTPAEPVTITQQAPAPAPAPQPEIQIDLPDQLPRIF